MKKFDYASFGLLESEVELAINGTDYFRYYDSEEAFQAALERDPKGTVDFIRHQRLEELQALNIDALQRTDFESHELPYEILYAYQHDEVEFQQKFNELLARCRVVKFPVNQFKRTYHARKAKWDSLRSGTADSGRPLAFAGLEKNTKCNDIVEYLIDQCHACKVSDGCVDNLPIAVYDDKKQFYCFGQEEIITFLRSLDYSLKWRELLEIYNLLAHSPRLPVKKYAPPELLPLKSSIYDVINDKFITYSPDYIFQCKFPWDYDRDAPMDEDVYSFIHAVCDGNEQVVKLCFELCGALLFRQNRWRGAFFAVGAAGSGKSSLLNLLSQFVGEQNAAATSLRDLNSKFRLSKIFGKSFAFADDMRFTDQILDDSIFKTVVTGGIVTGEQKGCDPFDFKPFCKLFFCMNELPSFADHSAALYSRMIIFPLNHNFYEDKNFSANYKDRIWPKESMDFFLKNAVCGLRDLLKRGRFFEPDACREKLNEFIRDSDPIATFVSETEPDLIGHRTQEIFDRFNFWAAQNGFSRTSATRFTVRVCELYHLRKEKQMIPYQESKRGWVFVR